MLATIFGQGGVIGDDGLIAQVGDYSALASAFQSQYPHISIQHFKNRIIAPGFVDMHTHYPQIDVIGSPADGLLPWLNEHTFPEEAKFADPVHAASVAEFFTDELLGNGVTTALCFATSHAASVDALFHAASDPLIWELHPAKNRYMRVEFDRYFDAAIASEGALRKMTSCPSTT